MKDATEPSRCTAQSCMASRSRCSRVEQGEQKTTHLYKYARYVYHGASCSITSLVLDYLIIKLSQVYIAFTLSASTHYFVTNPSRP